MCPSQLMCPSRLELLPPGVLDISLSKLTYGELSRASVSKTLWEGVQLVVSSVARRFGLSSAHHLGTRWLWRLDLGARNARVAMCLF